MNDVQQKFGIDSSVVFRFSIPQLQMMIDTLNIPEHFIFCGHRSNGIEALTVSLHRLACPIRFADLSIIYDLLPSHLSQIFAGFMLWIYDTFGDLVRSFQNPWTTERHWLELFSSNLEAKGCPLKDTFGFIDGTHIEVCRPVRDQRSFYCGHHRCHCFKCLVAQLPNGILLSFGPFNGSQHDSSQAEVVAIGSLLATHCAFPDRSFLLYADSGFAIGEQLITPF